MTNFTSTHKFSAAAAFGAAVLFSMLSFGGSAEAASVFSCKGKTASSVSSCCEQLVKKNGRPAWMVQTGTSCKKATVCRGGHELLAIAVMVAKPCYVQAVYMIKEGGGKKRDNTPSRNQPK